mmetsp:Transcript_22276/g.50932  ORF Transcript_22276/g.50932 Transcript_22276/m.50932 type:complete len:240 (+) Transcript_22276:1695-2414(+)
MPGILLCYTGQHGSSLRLGKLTKLLPCHHTLSRLVDQLHNSDHAALLHLQWNAQDVPGLEACLDIHILVETFIIVCAVNDNGFSCSGDMASDTSSDRYSELPTGRIDVGVQLLIDRVDEKDGCHFCSKQLLGLIHNSSQHAACAELRIHEQGALHERIDGPHEVDVGSKALLGLHSTKSAPDCSSVRAEYLLKVLFYGVPQGMVRKQVLLRKFQAVLRRCVVIQEPSLYVPALIGVPIC